MIALLRSREEAGQMSGLFHCLLPKAIHSTKPDSDVKLLIIDGDPALLIPPSRAVRLN